jgi:hypothetical protein
VYLKIRRFRFVVDEVLWATEAEADGREFLFRETYQSSKRNLRNPRMLSFCRRVFRRKFICVNLRPSVVVLFVLSSNPRDVFAARCRSRSSFDDVVLAVRLVCRTADAVCLQRHLPKVCREAALLHHHTIGRHRQ